MELELGFKANHSEDMVVLAYYQTREQAERAFFLLSRALYDVQAGKIAAVRIGRKFGKRAANQYLKEKLDREIEQFGQTMDAGIDWNPQACNIAQKDKTVKFMVYTSGYVNMIETFLRHCEGNLKVEKEDQETMSSPESVLKYDLGDKTGGRCGLPDS